ncbi:MAG: DUF4864 domain-containing protein [Pseudomonadota bacterium]
MMRNRSGQTTETATNRFAILTALAATLLVMAALVLAGPAQAEPSSATENAVRGVIESQIDAFRRDDANGAYRFAAPSIKQRFPNPDIFMDMVRRGYAPVYRPQDFDFGTITGTDAQVQQHVDIVGPNSELWTAVYTLQRGSEGDWRITGVYLVKQPGISS